MVTTYATPGNVRRELLAAVRARGHDAIVLAPEPEAVMGPALAELGVGFACWDVDRTGIDPRADARAAAALLRQLRALRPDVLLVYQIKAVLLAPLAAALARVPRVVALVNGLGSVFDDHGFGLTWKARVARLAYAASLRLVDRLVFQNPDDPALLRARGLLRADAAVDVVPGTGVDLARFAPASHAPARPTFTLVSRLVRSKGVGELVEAARIVRREVPGVRVRLVGPLEAEGHPDAIARRDLDAWVAEGVVEYAGFTTDIRGVLADTTVFVLPSYYREGIPRTNLEALAMGLPIITTDWVGCRETVRDGANGFLVPIRDARALADRMLRYLREPALVATHGAASRALAARFDIHRVNALMLEALGLG